MSSVFTHQFCQESSVCYSICLGEGTEETKVEFEIIIIAMGLEMFALMLSSSMIIMFGLVIGKSLVDNSPMAKDAEEIEQKKNLIMI